MTERPRTGEFALRDVLEVCAREEREPGLHDLEALRLEEEAGGGGDGGVCVRKQERHRPGFRVRECRRADM